MDNEILGRPWPCTKQVFNEFGFVDSNSFVSVLSATAHSLIYRLCLAPMETFSAWVVLGALYVDIHGASRSWLSGLGPKFVLPISLQTLLSYLAFVAQYCSPNSIFTIVGTVRFVHNRFRLPPVPADPAFAAGSRTYPTGYTEGKPLPSRWRRLR